MLLVTVNDVRRATLPLHAGNEGWIGVSPNGQEYHVVVPVDSQIARGVMACNRPQDGTPFGGYAGWLYFRCVPYEDEGRFDPSDHDRQVKKNAADLIEWLRSYGIQARLTGEAETERPVPRSQAGQAGSDAPPQNFGPSKDPNKNSLAGANEPRVIDKRAISCAGCNKSWQRIQAFLSDPTVNLDRYRAFPDNFRQGRFLFVHACGTVIEIPTTMFVKPGSGEKSLIGTNACPGLCYHETSFSPCSARCEGSRYRRIACSIKSRHLNRGSEALDRNEMT